MKNLLLTVIVALGLTPLAHADLNDSISQGGEIERGWGRGRPNPTPYPPSNPGRGPGHGGPGHGGPRPRPEPPRPAPPRPRPQPPRPGPGYPPPPVYHAEYMRCESYGNYGAQECYINPYRVQTIRLYNQYSYEPCIQGRTYGWNYDRIWVSNGCRATFEIIRY